MGQKQSKSGFHSRYLSSLPEYYERIGSSEVYSIRNENHNCIQSTNPQIPNPQNLPSKQKHDQSQILDSKTVHSQKSTYIQGLPSYLRHFVIVLNECQTKNYLNHLIYRNQPEFKEFIIQLPFGKIEKHQKYTKIHLYAEEVALTLNHVFNLPFYDMCIVLYTALIAYKYLYSYFGLFKIQDNMIGFTREGKTKVWLNHKLTKDKPLPIVTDINLKRYKQEENYMVDDLMQIFWNKVDRQTVPKNFTLINKFSSIRNSRHNPSRLTVSRTENQVQIQKLLLKSLQSNLVDDFSEGSFDKCMQYLEMYLNMKKPQFLKLELLNQNPQIVQQRDYYTKQIGVNSNTTLQPYRNFIPSIDYLLKNRKEFSHDSTDLRSSTVNFNINFKQHNNRTSSYNSSQINIRNTESLNYNELLNRNSDDTVIYDSKFQGFNYIGYPSQRDQLKIGRQSICRQVNLQSIEQNSFFNRPAGKSQPTNQPSTLSPTMVKSETKTTSNQGLGQMNNNHPMIIKKGEENNLQSVKKSQKISMKIMLQPEVNSSFTPYDTVTTSQHQPINSHSIRPFSEIRSPSSYYMNQTHPNKNIRSSLVHPYQINPMEQSQTVNRNLQFDNRLYQGYQGKSFQNKYQAKRNTIINGVLNI